MAAQHNFHFDSCQMPLNVMDYHFRSFAHQVVPKLVAQGIAVLAMKTLGGADGIILKSKTVTAIECLHYALNLPTSVVITGMDSLERVEQAVEAARTFKPMSKQEVATLVAKTRTAAAKGEFELFKTATRFDGTANNPKWMG
jgi:aryl-alcohol dehydrogenase-like predicted oxidoreductase